MKTVLLAIVFAVLFLVLIRYIEKNSIYYPMKEVASNPGAADLFYEEIYFDTADNKKLNGWFIPGDKESYTVIFCHGNAGNIGHRIKKIAMLHELGLSVFIFDYRGYGKSEGIPSEEGLYIDAAAAYKYLMKERNVPEENVILYGESIGGAVAIDLAQKETVCAVITEETFTSIKDMVSVAYPFMPSFVFSSRFNVISKIKNVDCPKLIIHSVNDEIVPFYLGEKLFTAAASPKKLLKIKGSHNTAFLDSENQFIEGIKLFVEGLKRK